MKSFARMRLKSPKKTRLEALKPKHREKAVRSPLECIMWSALSEIRAMLFCCGEIPHRPRRHARLTAFLPYLPFHW